MATTSRRRRRRRAAGRLDNELAGLGTVADCRCRCRGYRLRTRVLGLVLAAAFVHPSSRRVVYVRFYRAPATNRQHASTVTRPICKPRDLSAYHTAVPRPSTIPYLQLPLLFFLPNIRI